MSVTLYHNPACGTSRTVLGLIQETGIEPEVVLYLKTPLSREKLADLVDQTDLTARDLLRQKGALYEELGLNGPAITDAEILDAIAAHPALLNRPIVVTEKGAAACRPAETVLRLLP
ncbi:arsenate reductase (glutaredoxin) [Acetobacter orleanensis]|uniref:Arsenate reductase n=1 Tax=Acetobacter orleanensis TaxID=104099 RepID=A0A4Y3TK19_9PROT|nr:arsenate reductase (glutaredoxin) [Acetobacter orleanensis]KXV63007.1 arsenate reductase [Acetobacter orleanensis]PCD78844.1 arsenate reductase (glutaredoxin) [Acetobacter orleanensis]GAN68840.1 arsenate reductase [Acetobacter orleanensis JCM 7639]GBR23047.1 arsenate reductase [Acetobacter orleanensis NRIC 0473]GEB83331.1 arsenate reductase [Acetobacter orleanensis]